MRRLAAAAVFLAAAPLAAQQAGEWKAHDMSRPRPAVVTPGVSSLPLAPPSDAVVLFDGSSLDGWSDRKGAATKWVIRDGAIESVAGAGFIYSRKAFGDVQLHIEWETPVPATGEGQDRGNSGVFLMGLYEVQVLDSYQNDTYPDGQAGAVYGQYPPLVNASRAPGQWQSYDMVFRRPRFDPAGALLAPARITVLQNGVLIQDNVTIRGPTTWLERTPYARHPDRLPLSLQDHGHPVRYRNIWVRELRETGEPGPAPGSEPPVIALPAGQFDRYLGRYRSEGGLEIVVARSGDTLAASIDEGEPLELLPNSITDFSLRWTAGTMRFELPGQPGTPASSATFSLGGVSYLCRRL
jgi:hypothetical protein